MADPTTDDLLEFTTQTAQRHITIDGKPYVLRRMMDLPLDQHLFIERTMPELARVSLAIAADAATKAEKAKLSVDLHRIATIAVAAPGSVLSKLGDAQKLELCRVFLGLPLPRLGRPEAKTSRRASRSTGAKSSRA